MLIAARYVAFLHLDQGARHRQGSKPTDSIRIVVGDDVVLQRSCCCSLSKCGFRVRSATCPTGGFCVCYTDHDPNSRFAQQRESRFVPLDWTQQEQSIRFARWFAAVKSHFGRNASWHCHS